MIAAAVLKIFTRWFMIIMMHFEGGILMRTLIVYATNHGTTADCARKIAEKLPDGAKICQLGRGKVPSLDAFDLVLLGGSIHIGKIQKKVQDFVVQQKSSLLVRRLGLFICCMADGDQADVQLKAAFPADLIEHAAAVGFFGGCYKFSQMSWLTRRMIAMIEKQQGGREVDTRQDIDRLKPDAIDAFVQSLV